MDRYLLNKDFDVNLIAPCGMNCGICIAYLRTSKPCAGCRLDNSNKPKHCTSCVIKNCEYLAQTESGFCFDCLKFPCKRMNNLDKRYKQNYNISLIQNLEKIKQQGLSVFIKKEQERWKCKYCGMTLSIHRTHCLSCNKLIE